MIRPHTRSSISMSTQTDKKQILYNLELPGTFEEESRLVSFDFDKNHIKLNFSHKNEYSETYRDNVSITEERVQPTATDR
jgi:hypothetical protein